MLTLGNPCREYSSAVFANSVLAIATMGGTHQKCDLAEYTALIARSPMRPEPDTHSRGLLYHEKTRMVNGDLGLWPSGKAWPARMQILFTGIYAGVYA